MDYLEQKCPDIYVQSELLQELVTEELAWSKTLLEKLPYQGNVLCGLELDGQEILFAAYGPNLSTLGTPASCLFLFSPPLPKRRSFFLKPQECISRNRKQRQQLGMNLHSFGAQIRKSSTQAFHSSQQLPFLVILGPNWLQGRTERWLCTRFLWTLRIAFVQKTP